MPQHNWKGRNAPDNVKIHWIDPESLIPKGLLNNTPKKLKASAKEFKPRKKLNATARNFKPKKSYRNAAKTRKN